jgi:hypothetical protein
MLPAARSVSFSAALTIFDAAVTVLGRPVWRRVEGDFAELLTLLTVILANSSLSRSRETDEHRSRQ